MLLQKLKNLDLDRIDLDEAIALATFGEQMKAGYESRTLEVPDWLTDNLREINSEIKNRRRDYLEKARKEARAALESLKTASEKRADLQKRLESLDKALA